MFREQVQTIREIEREKKHDCADNNQLQQVPAELAIPIIHIHKNVARLNVARHTSKTYCDVGR